MTTWQRFFKAIGGTGPGDPWPPSRWDLGLPEHIRPVNAGEIAQFFMWLGFLARDPNETPERASFYYCMKWQWAFWKGPYHDYVVQNRHLPGHNIKMRWVRSRAPWDDI